MMGSVLDRLNVKCSQDMQMEISVKTALEFIRWVRAYQLQLLCACPPHSLFFKEN